MTQRGAAWQHLLGPRLSGAAQAVNPQKMEKASARNKLMDYLARRDHSEKELWEKLRRRFSDEEVTQAIQEAKDSGWLPDTPEAVAELSQRAAGHLHRRNKGALWINNYLREKGLPEVPVDEDTELAKALELVKNKFQPFAGDYEAQQKDRARMARFLTSRGFANSVIRKVMDAWKN